MAQHVDKIMEGLYKFVDKKLIQISQTDPLLGLIKPFATRAINNNLYKVEGMLKQVSDKDGLIDTDGILSEMIDNIVNSKPFLFNTGILGDLEIGAGKIKMDIPFMNKSVVLNQKDLMELKDMLSH